MSATHGPGTDWQIELAYRDALATEIARLGAVSVTEARRQLELAHWDAFSAMGTIYAERCADIFSEPLDRTDRSARAATVGDGERERWRRALSACDAALSQCEPCADPGCRAVQREYIDAARAAAAPLLRKF